MREGDFVLANESSTRVLSYLRVTKNGQAVLIALNFTATPQVATFDLSSRGIKGRHAKTLIESFSGVETVDLGHIALAPFGAYVGQVEP